MFNLSYLSYLIKIYIFIDKKCLVKPFSYETCCCLSAIKWNWSLHLIIFLYNMFQKSDQPSPHHSVDSPTNFYCLHQRPPPSYFLYTQVMLILILINVQYLHIVIFSFERKSLEWSKSLVLKFPSIHKIIPSPQQKFSFVTTPYSNWSMSCGLF